MKFTVNTYSPECGLTNFTDPTLQSADIALQENLVNDAIEMYGTKISYYPYNYRLDKHDYLYGEDVTAPFLQPIEMKALVQYQMDALMLSKFGMMNDADLTVVISIRDFQSNTSAISGVTEPMMEDLIRLDWLGVARPGGGYDLKASAKDIVENISGIKQCVDPEEFSTAYAETLSGLQAESFDNWLRGAPIFEITEKRDISPTMGINFLQSSYVWYIKCKRFDYTYQPNAPVEQGSDQVSDETFFGRLTGGENPPSPEKKYPQNAEDASDGLFDYGKYGGYDSTYGKY